MKAIPVLILFVVVIMFLIILSKLRPPKEEEANYELSDSPMDSWYQCLTISQKEKVVSYVTEDRRVVRYPECTAIWKKLPYDDKRVLYVLFTDEYGNFSPFNEL